MLRRPRSNIRPQRTFDDMARDLDLVYRTAPATSAAGSAQSEFSPAMPNLV